MSKGRLAYVAEVSVVEDSTVEEIFVLHHGVEGSLRDHGRGLAILGIDCRACQHTKQHIDGALTDHTRRDLG